MAIAVRVVRGAVTRVSETLGNLTGTPPERVDERYGGSRLTFTEVPDVRSFVSTARELEGVSEVSTIRERSS